MNEKNILKIVNAICDIEFNDCRGLNKAELGRELLNLANVPTNAMIQEIPLDWDAQVIVLFLLPNDTNYYSLFAGIGTDDEFHFDLTITGKLNGKYFNFFKEEKILDINFFSETRQQTTTTNREDKQMTKQERLEKVFEIAYELIKKYEWSKFCEMCDLCDDEVVYCESEDGFYINDEHFIWEN